MNPLTTTDKIIQSVCELQETPDLDHPETIVISLTDLRTIIENKIDAQWHPIETCPRDGTKVLLTGGVYHGAPFAGYWGPSEYDPNRPWVSVVNDHSMYEHCPTHWMPFPPKPLNT